MAKLGEGDGTDFPGAIDTREVQIDSPSADKTLVDANLFNDILKAIIAGQSELGVNVAGSIGNLVSRLGIVLEDDGTLKSSTVSSANINSTISIAKGGTGSSNASAALTALGITTFVKTFLDDANAAAVRATLELGTASILNTGVSNGDVIKADSTGLPTIDGSQLTGVIVDLKSQTGSFSHDLSDATGPQEITGVGFKPKLIWFVGANTSVAGVATWGFSHGAASGQCLRADGQVTADLMIAQARSLYFITGGINRKYGDVTTLGNDGFTITWTKLSSPTGTVTIKWMALG